MRDAAIFTDWQRYTYRPSILSHVSILSPSTSGDVTFWNVIHSALGQGAKGDICKEDILLSHTGIRLVHHNLASLEKCHSPQSTIDRSQQIHNAD